MSKITVKHYLEKRVKPETKDSGNELFLLYPVYFQVIYNKCATNKRSRTLIITTERSFENYLKTGKLFEKETDTRFNTLDKKEDRINDERTDVINSIKLIDEIKLKVNRKTLLLFIEAFSKGIYKCLLNQLWFEYFTEFVTTQTKTDYDYFFQAFNQDSSLITSINMIKNITNIDLLEYVKQSDLIKWEALSIVSLDADNKTTFAKFYFSGYKQNFKKHLNKNTLEYYENIINVIDTLLKEFIKGVVVEVNPPQF